VIIKARDPEPQRVGFPEVVPNCAPKFDANRNFRPRFPNILHFSKPYTCPSDGV